MYNSFLRCLDVSHPGLTPVVVRQDRRKMEERNEGAERSGHGDSTLSFRARSARNAKSNYSREHDIRSKERE